MRVEPLPQGTSARKAYLSKGISKISNGLRHSTVQSGLDLQIHRRKNLIRRFLHRYGHGIEKDHLAVFHLDDLTHDDNRWQSTDDIR